MSIYRSFFTVGFLTILSRLVGFFREILLARELGACAVSDAIKMATKLPSLFRRVFAEGAFNASFVPMFSSLLAEPDGKKNAITFAEQILSWLTLILCILILFVECFMPLIYGIICPGFDAERLQLSIQFTRITFPFILFISLTAFYSGILNSVDRFVFVASSPMIGNIFIVAFVFLTKFLDKSPAFGFSIAVLGCGIIQMLWVLIPSIQEGYVLKLRFPKITPQIKAFFIKVGPAALGAGIVQVNILVDMLIASSLPKGYISYLDYAERLNQLPLSVIGTAMSTVLLPLMSRQVAAGKTQDALSTQKNSIEFAMLLTLPSTCGLILWSVPIVGMIYQYGMFTAKDTVATANALTAFASGLPAYILIKIFSTTFFSNKDTKTPVVVAVCAVFLNIILNLLFIQILGHVGLALATSITAWINALTLGYILFKRGLFTLDQQLGTFFTRLSCAILLAMPFLLTIKKYLDPIVCYTGWIKGVYIIIAAMIGVFIFAMTCWLTGAFKLDHFRSNFSPART